MFGEYAGSGAVRYPSEVMFVEHTTATVDIGATVAEIDRLPAVRPPSVYYPVAD